MTKKERERIRYCFMANCRDFRRCRVKWGKDCVRHMGKKIPRFKSFGELVVVSGGPGPGDEIRVRRVSGDPYYR